MKNKVINFISTRLLLLLCFSTQLVSAQNKQGVYLSPQDFKNHRLFPENGVCKLNTHPFFHPEFIRLNIAGKKVRIPKDSIYGYREQEQDFRLLPNNNKCFQILEADELVMYCSIERSYGYKGTAQAKNYYFSLNPDSDIYRLSLHNLKNCYASEYTLHHQLDLVFEQLELYAYNETQHTYQLNYLLKHIKHNSHD